MAHQMALNAPVVEVDDDPLPVFVELPDPVDMSGQW